MSARLFTLPRPDDDQELLTIRWNARHGCGPAMALRRVVGDPDLDLIEFPVGQVGYGIPLDTPFEVRAVDKCKACGALLRAWFQWKGPLIVTTLWTPGS